MNEPIAYDNVKDHFVLKGVIIYRAWYNPYLYLNELFKIPATLHNEYRAYQIAYRVIRDAKEKAQITELLRHHFKSK